VYKRQAKYGLLDEAIIYYNQSLELNPEFINSRFDLAEALTLQGNFTQALKQIDIVIAKNNTQSRFYNLKGMILLWVGQPEKAAECSQQAIQRTLANKKRYFYNTGVTLGRAGYYSQGLWFLKGAAYQFPHDLRILYSLVENRLLAKDSRSAENYALQLLDGQSIISLESDLQKLRTDYSSVPVNVELISPLIIKTAKTAAAKLEQIPVRLNK
jgi:tetratricopeptide (TPR) repeat protein